MKNVRVLHIGLSSNAGGIENVVHSWIPYLPKWLQFDFINVEDKPIAFEDDFINAGAKIHKISARKKNPIRSYIQLKSILEKNQYDFVHHHIMGLSWPETVLITNRYSIKSTVILHSHCAINKHISLKYRLWHKIGKFRLRNARFLRVACGDDAGRNMYGENQFLLIENGIDLKECAYSEENRIKIRSQYNIDDGKLVVGHVGRATPPKNYPFIIEAFAELLEKVPDACLLLIGNVDKDAEVQNLIKNFNVQKNVICTGYVKNPKTYYSAMDVFFMPSHYEGLSVALVEAQASGLPCVVSQNVARESAISELVTFVSIDDCKKAVNALVNIQKFPMDRVNVKIDNNYNIINSSQKMFRYYLENMEK